MDIQTLRTHSAMIRDWTRMVAYSESINATCSGRTVCEIGVGLGPLSLMALRANATRVYGIERDPNVLRDATELIAANGFGPDRFIPIQGLSNHVRLPERVDVILSETLDSLGIGENTVNYMADARRRFLKPGGRMIPADLRCYFALANPRAYKEEEQVWARLADLGMDYGPVLRSIREVKHTFEVKTEELFSDWCLWHEVDFATVESLPSIMPMVLEVKRSGRIEGLASTFRSSLSEGVGLGTFPDDPPTHWKQGFVPFPSHPIEVKEGDLVYVGARPIDSLQPSLHWGLTVAHGSAEEVEEFLCLRMKLMESDAEQARSKVA